MPAPRFFHYAGILILFAWSAVLLYFFASGRVDFLLKGWFRYGPLLGGLGLAVMGVFNLFTANADVGCGHDHHHPHHDDDDHSHESEPDHHDHEDGDCCHHDHGHDDHHEHTHACGHDHEHDEHALHSHDDQTVPSILATMVIVLVPTFAAANMAQDRFSVDALANKGLYSNEVNARPTDKKASANTDSDRYTLADLEKQVRKSEEGNFLIPVPSLFYSAADEELADVLVGQPIETTGQVAPEIAENDPDGTRLRFYRLFVSCCLADARPIGFSAEFGKAPPEFTQDCWVKIVGEMIYPERDGRKIPVLKVNTIEAIPEPKDMMY